MSANLPILWLDKKNSPELQAFLKQYGDQYCMKAEEINQLRDAVNEMAVIQKTTFLGVAEPTDTPTGTGAGYWEVITPGTYTNHGGKVLGVDERGLITRDNAGAFKLSKVPYSFSSYLKIIDIIDNLFTDSGTKAASARQVKLLNEKFVDYATNTSVAVVQKIKDKFIDKFPFTDQFGNVMFEIGISGSKSTAYKIFDPITKLEVVSLNKAWYDALLIALNANQSLNSIKGSAKPDGFYFTDSVGNVIGKMTSNGFQSIKFINKLGEELGSVPKKLDGKVVVSLGDSHVTSPWFAKFCALTGSTSNTALQTYIQANQFNYADSGIMMGMAKALNQYTIDNAITPNVILIENCHFANDVTKTIADYAPMIYDNLQIYGTTYGSYSALVSNINTDKAAFVASLTPKVKTALRFNYSTFKHTINFSSSGLLTSGTIQLTINGSVFPINVTNGQTLSQAVTALNDWAFNETVVNWTNASTKGATRTTTIELVYTGTAISPTSPTVSFTGGTTGMSMTTNVLSSTVGFQDYYFNSLLLSEWNTSAKWIGTNGTTTYPAMMGLIEYLKGKFPLAEIVVWGVQLINVSNTPADANSYLVETFAGSGVYVRDIVKFQKDAAVVKYIASKEAMRITAQYYNCRFIDVDANCGINIFNMFNGYYAVNNVHPLTLGYEKWGETLAQLY